jgi:quercetin dioxygenase-like cupin family protein
MQTSEFISTLASEGFPAPVQVVREADGFVDTHSHPFEAKALITQGEIRIRRGADAAGADFVCRVGDVFHLSANEPHAEWYGPEGVSYLVGRK